MADLITPDDLPRWVPGELTLDTHAMDWDGVRLRGYRYDSSDVPVPAMQDYMIVAYQHGHTPMQRRCEGPWRSDRMVPGDISVLTHAAESHWTWSEPIEVIHLYLSPAKVAEVASSAFDRDIADVELVDVLKADDPVVSAAIGELIRESREPGLGGQMYVEALTNQVCVRLLRHYASGILDRRKAAGTMSRQRCQIIQSYIEDNLEQNLTLKQLADVLQLSVFHFVRQFGASFGCSPHVYVTRQRINRAKRLLARCDMPLKLVAAQCGFSDQSHMTRLFRRLLDITPGDFRAEYRSRVWRDR